MKFDEKELNHALEILQKYKGIIDVEKEEQPIATHVLFPIPHIRWNYQALARKMFPVEQLPPGALPVYDREDKNDV